MKNCIWHCQAGTSLVELIVVISLMAMLLTVVGRFSLAAHDYLLHSQVRVLFLACRYAQQRALARSGREEINFDLEKKTYRCCQITEHLAPGVLFGTSRPVYGPPGKPSRLIQKPISFMGEKIVFYPTGIMQAGTVYLTDVHKKATYALSNAVSAVSHMRIYRLDGKKWNQL